MSYREEIENPNFKRGQRVVVTKDIKLHFGGVLRKGEKGTYKKTVLIGNGRWVEVEMDIGYNMSFTRDSDIKIIEGGED